VSAELRDNILRFYAGMKGPDPHGVDTDLAELKAYGPLMNTDAHR